MRNIVTITITTVIITTTTTKPRLGAYLPPRTGPPSGGLVAFCGLGRLPGNAPEA